MLVGCHCPPTSRGLLKKRPPAVNYNHRYLNIFPSHARTRTRNCNCNCNHFLALSALSKPNSPTRPSLRECGLRKSSRRSLHFLTRKLFLCLPLCFAPMVWHARPPPHTIAAQFYPVVAAIVDVMETLPVLAQTFPVNSSAPTNMGIRMIPKTYVHTHV